MLPFAEEYNRGTPHHTPMSKLDVGDYALIRSMSSVRILLVKVVFVESNWIVVALDSPNPAKNPIPVTFSRSGDTPSLRLTENEAEELKTKYLPILEPK